MPNFWLFVLYLGQEKFSYGYESKGKIYKGGEVADFGENLAEGDVLGVYIVSFIHILTITLFLLFLLL